MQRLINTIPRIIFVSSVLGGIATAWTIYARLASATCRSQTRATTQRHPLTYEQKDEQKREFVNSIREEAICELASRHNDRKHCRVFGSGSGSFNACFFVEFPDDGTRWVLRVPIQPAVYDDCVKVRSEVATMQYIRSKTTIPIPRVRAFGEGEVLTLDSSTTQAYLILDYIPGHSLDIESLVQDTRERRDHFYAQLADILAQMRALEFPSAGSLLPDPVGRPDRPILGPLCSIHINEMQVQGSTTAAPSTAFTSATDFCLHQLSVIKESYRLPISDQSFKEARRDIFALEHLEREVPRVINASWNKGPFVLSHLDLRWNNIIVDGDLNIRAVIDWEWAGSIPRQLFTPPSWIAGREPPYITGDEYRSEFAHFRRVLLAKGERCRQLVEEWDLEMMDGVALPIAEVLRHHSQLNPIFFTAMYPKLFEGPSWKVVPRFFDRPENRELEMAVQEQVERSAQYTMYLGNKGLFVPDEKARADAEKAEELQNWLMKIQEG